MHHTKTKSRELQFKQSYSQVSCCWVVKKILVKNRKAIILRGSLPRIIFVLQSHDSADTAKYSDCGKSWKKVCNK